MTNEEAARRLGLRVFRLRELCGWTQGELSDATRKVNRVGINRPNISRLEAGRYGSVPYTPTILLLALAFDVQPTAIFGALDDPPSHVPSSTHAVEARGEPEDNREERSE